MSEPNRQVGMLCRCGGTFIQYTGRIDCNRCGTFTTDAFPAPDRWLVRSAGGVVAKEVVMSERCEARTSIFGRCIRDVGHAGRHRNALDENFGVIESPAPVVAEVRRAPQEVEPKVLTLVERLHGQAASLQAKWEQKAGTYREVQIAALLDLAAIEVARLIAERDEASAMLYAVLREQPWKGDEYVHLLTCSGSRKHPPGTFGVTCSCPVGRRRADKVRADLASLRTRLRGLEQQWRKLARQRQEVAGGAQTDLSRYTNLASSQAGTECADELARLLTTPEEP